MTSKKQLHDNYILATGHNGDQRLKILNKVLGKHSSAFLIKKALKPGMRIAEIGCGTGNMLAWLSKQVGPKGKVYAVDCNEQQLAIAAKKIAKFELNNVELILDDAQKLNMIPEKLDLIYSRLLLLHLPSPTVALQKMKHLLKDEGFLVLEEMAMSTGFCYPHSDHYTHSRVLFNQLANIKGLDFDIGAKLDQILQSVKMRLLDINHIQSTLHSQEERQMLWMSVEESAGHFIQNKLSSYSEILFLSNKLKEISHDNSYIVALPRLTQVCAKKNESAFVYE